MPRRKPTNLLLLCALLAMVSGCGTSTGASSVIRTLNILEGVDAFDSVLVVSVAGDRALRTQFEQEMVAAISSDDTLATPYFAVVGRHNSLTRSLLNNAVRVRKFDAVLLTRLLGQDKPGLVPNRPTGRQFDLFRYDYEELNFPVSINTDSTVAFVVEIYDARESRKVWAIESLLFETETASTAVSAQAAIIVAEIRKDGVIRR